MRGRGEVGGGGEVEHQVAQREEQDRGPVGVGHGALYGAEGGGGGDVGVVRGCELGGVAGRGAAEQRAESAHGGHVRDQVVEDVRVRGVLRLELEGLEIRRRNHGARRLAVGLEPAHDVYQGLLQD